MKRRLYDQSLAFIGIAQYMLTVVVKRGAGDFPRGVNWDEMLVQGGGIRRRRSVCITLRQCIVITKVVTENMVTDY